MTHQERRELAAELIRTGTELRRAGMLLAQAPTEDLEAVARSLAERCLTDADFALRDASGVFAQMEADERRRHPDHYAPDGGLSAAETMRREG